MNGMVHKIFGILTLLISLGLTLTSAAASKRYIVSVKSGPAYQTVLSQVNELKLMSATNEGEGLFGTKAVVKDTLDGIEMLIIESSHPSDIAKIKAQPNVIDVEEEIFFDAPQPMNVDPLKASYVVIPYALDVPWGITAVKAPQAWSLSNYGVGARVMVLDTGIDKDHIDLASRFEKGQNFFNDNNPGPYDFFDLIGHGTHVAGTIAADGNHTGLVGVAPGAAILAGRVCGTRGCSSVAILQGVNWGVQENVDVISMSLGGPFPPSSALAYERAYAQNIVIVAAAGNDGTGKLSYPAALPTVIAVGAVDSTLARAQFSQYGDGLDIMGPGVDVLSSVPTGSAKMAQTSIDFGKGLQIVNSTMFQGAKEATQPLLGPMVYAGLGKETDFVNDVSGKVALISRGEINFADKVKNAMARGAVGVVIFNNQPGLITGSLTSDGSVVDVPVVMIEESIGTAIATNLNRGHQQTVQIATIRTSHQAMSGTSMATPHVSGVVALIKATNRNLTVEQVRQILHGSAHKLGAAKEYGAGLTNAEAAVQAAASATPLQVAN
ncbi:MAG: S8 family serine peptidase [Bdellovibrionales bacterium]|nr:S8 family serine peptidase [Bdellovibrionales bacterium]